MASLSRLFWTYVHRSDASTSWRWLALISATLALMPVLGSGLGTLLLCGGVLAFVYLVMDRKRIRFDRTECVIALVLMGYLGIALLSAVLRYNPVQGLKVVFNNIGFLVMLPLLPVLRFYYRDSWEKIIIRAVIAGGFIAGIVALLEVTVVGHVRAHALAGNALIFAYLAAVTAVINMSLAVTARGRITAFFLGAAASASVAVFLSGGRGPVLFLALTALALLVFWAGKASSRQIKGFIAFGTIAAALAGSLFFLDNRAIDNTLRRFEIMTDMVLETSAKIDDGSISARVALYRAGWAVFTQRPFVGYGPQNLISTANARFADDPIFTYTQLHNAFLSEAVASGIIGLMTFIPVIMLPLLAAWSGERKWFLVAISHTVFFVLYSMTNLGFYHDIKVCHFAFMICLLNALNRNSRVSADSSSPPELAKA